ncbi:aromatic ring-hydroxylating dioxygenase subunit alpha, partial [Rhodoferax sp.]|uniref:aromatic ring-hydroxylating oxygenase subunit alpha n=1 Tax=Rhodoferax sp. TaxID=50421 RepID=UPI00271B1F7F
MRAPGDVTKNVTQLPVSSYFDEALYQRELQTLFQPGPRYVGHRLSVPEVGDYATLAHEGQGRALVHTPQGIELISNVCRHRQAVMLQGRGSVDVTHPGAAAGNIVCPLHRWTYSASGPQPAGTLLGAP